MSDAVPQGDVDRSRRPAEVRDPGALRALAHPTRLALLEVLTSEGTATATGCAELLGERVASCSFHLRTLARHGFIEPVPHQGKEKPWRLTNFGQLVPSSDLSPEQDVAADVLFATFLDREFSRLRRWQQHVKKEPAEWQQAATIQGATVWLTAQELDQLGAELRGLSERYFDRSEQPEKRPAEARPVRVFIGTSVGLPSAEQG